LQIRNGEPSAAASLQVSQVLRKFENNANKIEVGDLLLTVDGQDSSSWSVAEALNVLKSWSGAEPFEIKFGRVVDAEMAVVKTATETSASWVDADINAAPGDLYDLAFMQLHEGEEHKPVYKDLARIMSNHNFKLGDTNGPMLLDVGCGHGFLVAAAAEKGFGGGAYGIDGGGGSPQMWPAQDGKSPEENAQTVGSFAHMDLRLLTGNLSDISDEAWRLSAGDPYRPGMEGTGTGAKRQQRFSLDSSLFSAVPATHSTSSFEVAEHLPSRYARGFVRLLTLHQPQRVFFSAATPMQGGDGHINERPLLYWVELFEAHGYDLDVPGTVRARNTMLGETQFDNIWWYPKVSH
jgi:hypothetical protein